MSWVLVGLLSLAPQESGRLQDELRRLYRQLGDDDWRVREKAHAQILEIGRRHKALVRRFLKRKSSDPEVRARVAEIRAQLVWMKAWRIGFGVVTGLVPLGKSGFATASADGKIRVWDVSEGRVVREMGLGGAGIVAMTLGANAKTILALDRSSRLLEFDIETGKLRTSLEGVPDGVVEVFAIPGSRRVALSSSTHDQLFLWDLDRGREVARLGKSIHGPGTLMGGRVAAVSPDGREAALWVQGLGLQILDLRSGRRLYFSDKVKPVSAIAYSPDGKTLAYASQREVFLLDRPKKEIRRKLPAGGWTFLLAFSPDSKGLAISVLNYGLSLWDVTQGRRTATLMSAGYARALCFSPDGARLYAADRDNALRVWDTRSGKLTASLHGHSNACRTVALAPDGRRFAAQVSSEVHLVDRESGKKTKLPPPEGVYIEPFAIQFSPSGQQVAVGYNFGQVSLFDAASGKRIWTVKVYEKGAVDRLAFTPNGEAILTLSKWKGVARLKAADGAATAVTSEKVSVGAVSPAGDRLAFGKLNDSRVWLQPAGGGRTAVFTPDPEIHVRGIEFSPDGKTLAVWGNEHTGPVGRPLRSRLLLVHPATGRARERWIPESGTIMAAAFAPDTSRLAAGFEDGSIRIWDWKEGKVLRTLRGHGAAVTALSFSRGGALLVTASEDGTAILWER